jgi:hypothetical protein
MKCTSSDDLTDGMSWPIRFQAAKNPNNRRAPKLNQPHRHLEQATLHE